MRIVVALFLAVASIIAAVWTWLGAPVPMPPSPLAAGEKLYCVSYAPYRGRQSPFTEGIRISSAQIEEDLTRLSQATDCVRTYSTDQGIEQVPAIAAKLGMKVILGLWLSRHPDKNRVQIEQAVALSNEHKDTVRAVVVGNEVLLRGEMKAEQLADTLRSMKERTSVPITYAEVWEFWLRAPELAAITDFLTIHILPYWEDFPIPASEAGAHLASIRAKVAAAFPGKDILIGETGWPSAGRMREGALPSPSSQARVLHDVVNTAVANGYRVNLIEAFDQPWKRLMEGTVGGHWGLYDDSTRNAKFTWGAPVSDHPLWRLQAAAGIALALLTFVAAWAGRSEATRSDLSRWVGIAATAAAGGIFIGWSFEKLWLEALGWAGWLRAVILVGVATTAPLAAAATLASGSRVLVFSDLLNRKHWVPTSLLEKANGLVLLIVTILAVDAALGLVFDPRYRDFPFAALACAVIPMFVAVQFRGANMRPGPAEWAMAACLVLSGVYVAFNESFANWQAQVLVAELLLLALTLLRVSPAQRRA